MFSWNVSVYLTPLSALKAHLSSIAAQFNSNVGMYRSTVLALCLLVGQIFCQDDIDAEGVSRIVGGTKADIKDFPYLVSVRIDGQHVCGGALIDPDTVITAASCLGTTLASKVTVYAGSTSRTTGGVLGLAKGIVKHPSYNRDTLNYDMALIQLTAPLTGANIKPIPIYPGTLYSGVIVKTAGWGATREGLKPADTLRKVTLKVQTRKTCESIFLTALGTSMFCAGWLTGGISTCDGDYGGPLVYNETLVGIASIGNGCGRRDYTGLNTQVPMNRAWIQTNMVK